MADGGLPAHRRGPPRASCSARPGSIRTVHPHAWLAPGRRARPGGLLDEDARASWRPTPTASTPDRSERAPERARPRLRRRRRPRPARAAASAACDPEPWTPLDTLTLARSRRGRWAATMDAEIFRMLVDARLGDPALTDLLVPAYPDRPSIAAPEDLDAGRRPRSLPCGHGPRRPARRAARRCAALDRRRGPRSRARPTASPRSLAWPRSRTSWATAVSAPTTGSWPRALRHGRRRAARQRPAPRLRHAVDLVRERPPLPARSPTPARSTSRASRSRARRGHRRSQRRDRLGRDQREPRRPGPASRSASTRPTGQLPHRGRLGALHRPHRDHRGSPAATTSRSPCARPVHGPVLNDVDDRLRATGHLVRPALDGHRGARPGLRGVPGRGPRVDWDSFRAALAKFGAPSQNFVYADADGHIGYQMPGLVPVRTRDDDLGLRPVPGWDGEHEWESYVPFDELPSVFDPPSGRIVTANNAVHSDTVFIGAEFDRGDRAARILQLIDEAGDRVTLDTFSDIQGDTRLAVPRGCTRRWPDMQPDPTTRDGGSVLGRSPTGTAAATPTRPAAPRTSCSRWPWGGRSSTTSSAPRRATTRAPTSPRTSPPRWWARPRAARRPGGATRRPGTGADATAVTAAALDAAGACAAPGPRRSVGLDVGQDPHGPVPGGHPGRLRDRAAGGVLQHARGPPSTAPTAPSTTTTTASRAATRTPTTRSSSPPTPWRSCSRSRTGRRCGPCTT